MKLIDQLIAAVMCNGVQAIKPLLEQGAPINGIDEFGQSALHHAATSGNIKLVKL